MLFTYKEHVVSYNEAHIFVFCINWGAYLVLSTQLVNLHFRVFMLPSVKNVSYSHSLCVCVLSRVQFIKPVVSLNFCPHINRNSIPRFSLSILFLMRFILCGWNITDILCKYVPLDSIYAIFPILWIQFCQYCFLTLRLN